MRPLRILTLAFLLFTLTAAAQTDRRIEEQKRVIAALEKRIATEEQEISKIQKGRTATEERVRRLARQIDSRNQLLDETEKQARLLRGEIARTDSVAGNLSAKLERDRAQYGEMVREAYRNYKHNNYLTYIFSSRDFTDVARKITALREVASLRERKLRDIEALTAEVRTEKIGKFTKNDIMELCPSISKTSIENALKKLVESGALIRHGKGKSTFYTRSDIK